MLQFGYQTGHSYSGKRHSSDILYSFQDIFYSSYFRFLKFPKYLKFWIHCVLCTIVSKDTLHFLWSVSPLFTVNYQYLNKSLPRASPLPEWGILSLGLQSSLKVTSLTAHNNLCCSYSLSYPYPLFDHKLQDRGGPHLCLFFSFSMTTVILMHSSCSDISSAP